MESSRKHQGAYNISTWYWALMAPVRQGHWWGRGANPIPPGLQVSLPNVPTSAGLEGMWFKEQCWPGDDFSL